ncbi:DUF6285 domain-containing protein [Hydrogenophaga sp. BPS33]|uniref:DUF6285 domain-containing protein n=1 Tax=Hydrogenophaga sp. BPS33 TaxID=2651974 RepID=UPI00131F9F8B|nr:DUF6285 domain-containing protein [Hydrogenophaga sp. BPS33]QHE83429.1 hypothetical protein F9K07_00325 [Hydrogenophaga sp. BPS33]
MQHAPTTPELLRIARLSLLERVLPAVPAGLAREVRMVAHTLAIAQRSWAEQPEAMAAERWRLQALYPADLQQTTEALERRLATELRHWTFGAHAARENLVRAHLRQSTVEKLRENNPKALPASAT